MQQSMRVRGQSASHRIQCVCGEASGWLPSSGACAGWEAAHRDECVFTAADEEMLQRERHHWSLGDDAARAAHPSQRQP